MTTFGRLFCALPLLAVLLSACGGGGASSGATVSNQQQGVAVGEPSPAARVDTAPFVALAIAEDCAGTRNRLFVIDHQFVFWDRAGNCPDNAYAQRLYGKSVDKLLCSQADSIVGPRLSCSDAQAEALFAVAIKNGDKADLGLGPARVVEEVKFSAGTAVAFDTIERSKASLVQVAQQRVARDGAAWEALWREHAGNAPLPAVDFSKKMVLAVFRGATDPCHDIAIERVAQVGAALVASQVDYVPRAGVMCIMVVATPAHLVTVDRSDAQVKFSAQVRELAN